ncbi:MAG: RNase P subunit p30 family protein [Candidatus Heimdallarchaeaceae archaeon]
MQKNKFFPEGKFFSCENYITLKDPSELKDYCDFAFKLPISILTIDNMTIKEREEIVEKMEEKNYGVFSPKQIYEIVKDTNFSQKSMVEGIRNFLSSGDKNAIIIASRRTIKSEKLDEMKRKISKNRNNFEILSVVGRNKTVLKGAARDKRVDYVSLDLFNNEILLDDALCSLMKQNNKQFEIVLNPILNPQNNKEFSTILRNGKKNSKLILLHNVPFTLTINPISPFQLRTTSQLRHIGTLIGIPFNKSKNSTFENQISTIVTNTAKLHDNYVFEGIREV